VFALRRLLILALAVGVLPAVLTAQDPSPIQLERAGRLPEAAQAYREALTANPGNVSHLLGLERVLQRLDRLDSIRLFVAAALRASPRNQTIREVQFRVAAALDGADSVAVVAVQWIMADPTSEGPYRAWSQWLAQQGNVEGARAVIAQGRARLGDRRLAQYDAQYAMLAGDWPEAGSQWVSAVSSNPSLIIQASGSLRRAPESVRGVLLDALNDHDEPAGSWIASFLMASWDRPEEAWTLLDSALPGEDALAALLLRRFADRTGELGTSEALRSRGYALERLAEISTEPAANRARLDAARAFADAGNLIGAQRMLDRLAVASDTTSGEAAAAMATFIRVLADAGRVAEAEDRFREWESRMSARDVAAVKEKLAWGWVREGELDRAENLLVGDSTVGSQAVQGWVALYRGDLTLAQEQFRAAGPYTQSRDEATRRSGILVMLERIQGGRSPELGASLLAIERGDSARGVEGLREAALLLPPGGGRAEVLVLAGDVAAAVGDTALSENLLLEAMSVEPDGPVAPAAELALASLYASTGRNEEAARRLEHLVLTFPESAVVPQARRLLDRVRGAIPRS
jgi:tetratricopeptide (TPR) repeat protein